MPTDYSTKRLVYIGPEPVRRGSVQTPKKPPSSRGSNKPKSSGSRSTKPLSTSSVRPIEDPHDVKFILERLHKVINDSVFEFRKYLVSLLSSNSTVRRF